MNYEEVLTVILGAVGSRVSAAVMGTVPEGMDPPIVAQLRGTLQGGVELPQYEEGDVIALAFEESPDAFFMIDRRAFLNAEWSDPEATLLRVQIGSTTVLVNLDPP